MINVSGWNDGSQEWLAAELLKTRALADFPELRVSDRQHVTIFPSVKTPWHTDVKDVDLYVLADFRTSPLTFESYEGTLHRCWSLSFSIEVKSHTPPSVWIEGNDVWVRYSNGVKRATEQAFKQPFAIHSYYERKGFDKKSIPFVRDFVWLTQVEIAQFSDSKSTELPPQLLFADTTFKELLRKTLALSPAPTNDLGPLSRQFNFGAAIAAFSRQLVPTKLARDRVEEITKSRYRHRSLERLGSAQIAFNGYGGAGKTAILLRTAKELYEQGRRSLILTYHTALTSDLYRQLAVMRLRTNAFGESVRVETLHSFFRRWLIDLQEVDDAEINDRWFDDNYIQILSLVNDKLRRGEITAGELSTIKNDKPTRYAYDYLMVDEAQDWNDEERDFLYRAYAPDHFVLAIGHRQLVRTNVACNWIPPTGVRVENTQLRKCLRLKPNLSSFVTNVARAFGDNDFVIRSDDALRGGEVHLVLNPLSNQADFILNLVNENNVCATQNVDHLFCVPATQISESNGQRHSFLGDAFRSRGLAVYDAVDRGTRLGTPASVDDMRIVQYDSCRGLEGWIVFLDSIDDFFEAKANAARAELQDRGVDNFLLDQLASARALEWLLIPLTRAIDTLVISIRNPQSSFSKQFIEAAKTQPDSVFVHA